MKGPIPNASLRLTDIPSADADWPTINEFALTFDGYEAWGSGSKCAEVANAHRDGTLTELRTCLFFEQRRWHHFGTMYDEQTKVYLCGLVEKIRAKVASGDLE